MGLPSGHLAFSRVYLGVHWVTDVLGGISLAAAVLALWAMARVTLLFTPPSPIRDAPDGERVRTGPA